jgi:hypothetical protein
MKPIGISPGSLISLTLFLSVLFTSANAEDQKPIIDETFGMSHNVPIPESTPLTTTSTSLATCDFAPRPTGCELGGMAPFPFNCTMFYLCTTFGPIMQNCPNGTVFDFDKSKCLLKNHRPTIQI